MISTTGIQGLWASGTSVAVTANNIANMNTEEFQASRVDLEDGPRGEGVAVADIRRTSVAGPHMPGFEPYIDPTGQVEMDPVHVPGSNTDLSVEVAKLMRDQHAFEANSVSIRTQGELAGTVIDLFA